MQVIITQTLDILTKLFQEILMEWLEVQAPSSEFAFELSRHLTVEIWPFTSMY